MTVNRAGGNPSINSIASKSSTKSTKLPSGTPLKKNETLNLVQDLNKSFKLLLESIKKIETDYNVNTYSQEIDNIISERNEETFKNKNPALAKEIENFNPNLSSESFPAENYEP